MLQVNSLVPWFLFPMLETRGMRHEIQSREDRAVRILMRADWEPRDLPRKPRIETGRGA